MYWKEVVASLYAWDLLDEGLEQILDVLERETLTNSIYLVALMHDEKRPLTDFYYPHNPRRKVYWTEDSRAYWTPHPEAYKGSRIKPRTSNNPELRGQDWLRILIDGARKRGMTVGAELSHGIQQAGDGPTRPATADRLDAHADLDARLAEARARMPLQEKNAEIRRNRVEPTAMDNARARLGGAPLVAVDHASDPLDLTGNVAVVRSGLGADADERLTMQRVRSDG